MAGIPFNEARIAHSCGSGKKKRGMCVDVTRGSRWKEVTSCFRGSRPSRSSQKLQREKHVFDKRMEKYEAMVKEDDARKARRTSYQLSRKEQMRLKFAGRRRIPTVEFHRIQAVAYARGLPPYSYCFQWNSSCGCDIDHAGLGMDLQHRCIRCDGNHPLMLCRSYDVRLRRGLIEAAVCRPAG